MLLPQLLAEKVLEPLERMVRLAGYSDGLLCLSLRGMLLDKVFELVVINVVCSVLVLSSPSVDKTLCWPAIAAAARVKLTCRPLRNTPIIQGLPKLHSRVLGLCPLCSSYGLNRLSA